MTRCYFDLHIHSALSPCADNDMTVYNIANMAMLKELDFVAVTDHNSMQNVPAFFKACQRAGVVPVAGVEVCCAEEVHLLCLFPDLRSGMAFDRMLYATLPELDNRPDIFGDQLLFDAHDRVIGHEPRLLQTASTMDMSAVHRAVTARGGIVIPAHIDKPSFSLLSNLGFVPDTPPFSTFELLRPDCAAQLVREQPALAGKRLIHNSDAHALPLILERESDILLPERTAQALIAALA